MFLEIFYILLPLHLDAVVRAYPPEGFIIILNCINIIFSLLYSSFQLDRLIQLLVHHISLPSFSLLLSFLVLFIIGDVFLDNIGIDVLHLLLLGFFLLVVIIYHILEVTVQV
jgi:hypothetical protein